jgi:predicted nucleotidyltransferase
MLLHNAPRAALASVGGARNHVPMTKVREDAVVVAINGAARARLSVALDMPGVVAASLIGSQASGSTGPLSDVDLGVWLLPELSAPERHQRSLELLRAACEALGTDEVDLVVLNDASPLMRHRAMRDGIRLVERDRDARVRLEARGLLDYLDTAPLRATLAAGVKRRLEDGRFGRR